MEPIKGRIDLIIGPMFSGKSSELQRKVRIYQHAQIKCLVVNFSRDVRYLPQDFAAPHEQVKIKAIKTDKLKDVLPQCLQYALIAIDEAQFFPDIVEVAEILANKGKIVIVAALDATFQKKPFGAIPSLLSKSQTVTKLSAICFGCGKEASFTKRIIDCQQIELIGGSQYYKPVCRKCFELTTQQLHSAAVNSPSNPENEQTQEYQE